MMEISDQEKKWHQGLVKKLIAIKLFSPAGLVVCAVIIFGFHGILTLCGLRVYSGILSGSFPVATTSKLLSSYYGFFYLLSYVGFVIVGPILLLTAMIQTVFLTILKKKQT